jgi:hypothetical protein
MCVTNVIFCHFCSLIGSSRTVGQIDIIIIILKCVHTPLEQTLHRVHLKPSLFLDYFYFGSKDVF